MRVPVPVRTHYARGRVRLGMCGRVHTYTCVTRIYTHGGAYAGTLGDGRALAEICT